MTGHSIEEEAFYWESDDQDVWKRRQTKQTMNKQTYKKTAETIKCAFR